MHSPHFVKDHLSEIACEVHSTHTHHDSIIPRAISLVKLGKGVMGNMNKRRQQCNKAKKQAI